MGPAVGGGSEAVACILITGARLAPGPHEIANGEIEADEHHERDKPLIALGRTARDDKHAAVVEVRRAFPQEGANPAPATMAATNKSLAQMNKAQDMGRATKGCSALQSLLSWCRAGRAE